MKKEEQSSQKETGQSRQESEQSGLGKGKRKKRSREVSASKFQKKRPEIQAGNLYNANQIRFNLICSYFQMAELQGFEPWVRLLLHSLSKTAP